MNFFFMINFKKSLKVNETAWPWSKPKCDVNGYDNAWGAVVLEIEIAFPEKLAAKHIFNVLFELGFLI